MGVSRNINRVIKLRFLGANKFDSAASGEVIALKALVYSM